MIVTTMIVRAIADTLTPIGRRAEICEPPRVPHRYQQQMGAPMAHEHETPTTITICTDCYMHVGNGDLPDTTWSPYPDAPETECGNVAYLAAIAHEIGIDTDVTLGALADSGDCEQCTADYQSGGCAPCEPWFSWHACHMCGSQYGGNRMHATAWIQQ